MPWSFCIFLHRHEPHLTMSTSPFWQLFTVFEAKVPFLFYYFWKSLIWSVNILSYARKYLLDTWTFHGQMPCKLLHYNKSSPVCLPLPCFFLISWHLAFLEFSEMTADYHPVSSNGLYLCHFTSFFLYVCKPWTKTFERKK